jgi:hypothetical protein
MNKIITTGLGSLFLFSLALARADQAQPNQLNTQQQQRRMARQQAARALNDASIDQEVAHLQSNYNAHVAFINKQHDDETAFRNRTKETRLAYAQQVLNDRTAFYNSLKGMSPTDRKTSAQTFQATQNSKHAHFISQRKSDWQAFHLQQAREERDFWRSIANGNKQSRQDIKTKRQNGTAPSAGAPGAH